MTEEELLNNPNLKNIDKDKLNTLINLTSMAGSKSNNELLPFLLGTLSGGGGVDFNDAETEIILEALKPNMSPKQIKKIETIRNLSKMIASKSKPR